MSLTTSGVRRARWAAPAALGLVLLAGLAGCSGSAAQPAATPGLPTVLPTGSLTAQASTTAGESTGEASPSSSTSAVKEPSPSAKVAGYEFPVRSARAHYGAYHHDYPATDIFAPCGTRVAAPTDGRILEVSRKDVWSAKTNKGAVRGGLSVSMVGTDGVRYYGSHLRSIDASIKPGAVVEKGATLGRVGNTGDAAGIACHLHFGISPACGIGDWQIRRGAVSPYRFLKAWQAGRNLSPVKTVASWKAEHGC